MKHVINHKNEIMYVTFFFSNLSVRNEIIIIIQYVSRGCVHVMSSAYKCFLIRVVDHPLDFIFILNSKNHMN